MMSKTSTPTQSKRVLAIDPGFDRIGVAVLEDKGLLFSQCIETDRKLPHSGRLFQLGNEIRKVIKKWKPDALAIEELYFNQNSSNALKVSEARGVIIYEAKNSELDIFEYSPQAIKIAVTGYGKADKKQVEMMVRRLIELPNVANTLDDEIDAVALGICHLASKKGI